MTEYHARAFLFIIPVCLLLTIYMLNYVDKDYAIIISSIFGTFIVFYKDITNMIWSFYETTTKRN